MIGKILTEEEKKKSKNNGEIQKDRNCWVYLMQQHLNLLKQFIKHISNY